jgi:hypothetical protein
MTTETATTTKTCASCLHFKSSSSDQGECRRRAPQTVVFEVDDDVKFESRFPAVASTDWCGEYTTK